MRICWEFLDKLRLTKTKYSRIKGPPRFGTLRGVPGHQLLDRFWEYKDHCKYCGDDYFTNIDKPSDFCDRECRLLYKEWMKHEARILKERAPKKPKPSRHVSDELRAKFKQVFSSPEYRAKISGINNARWQGGVTKSRLISYKSHAHKFKEYDIRRSPEDSVILQLRCPICKKWFTPKINVLKTIKLGYKTYCSLECQLKARQNKPRKFTIKFKLPNNLPLAIKQRSVNLKRQRKEKAVYNNELKKCRKTLLRVLKNRLKDMRSPEYYNDKTKQWFENLRKNSPILWRAKRLLAGSKQNALEKKLPFDLDENWLVDLLSKKCQVTGIPFHITPDKIMDPYAPSIDRIDSTKGYTKDNCKVVIWAFNRAKGQYTEAVLYKILKRFISTYKRASSKS